MFVSNELLAYAGLPLVRIRAAVAHVRSSAERGGDEKAVWKISSPRSDARRTVRTRRNHPRAAQRVGCEILRSSRGIRSAILCCELPGGIVDVDDLGPIGELRLHPSAFRVVGVDCLPDVPLDCAKRRT